MSKYNYYTLEKFKNRNLYLINSCIHLGLHPMDIPARFGKIGTKRILICDDVRDNVLLLQFILEAEGYEVILADSGAATIALIERENPDLILLDRVMPGIDGIETALYIRQNLHNHSLPIILVAPSRRDTIPAEYQKLVNGVIHKPIESEELLPQVEAIFACPFSNSSKLEFGITVSRGLYPIRNR